MRQRRFLVHPHLAVTCLLAGSAQAAYREVIPVSWSEFEQQVSARRLEGRKVRIVHAGGEIRAKLVAVTEGDLVLAANRATRPWSSAKHEARIPRDQIRSVRFLGPAGHRGLLAGLLGGGAAAGIGAAVAASQDVFAITEGPVIIAAPLGIVAGAIGVGFACYFLARAASPPGPEFVIQQ